MQIPTEWSEELEDAVKQKRRHAVYMGGSPELPPTLDDELRVDPGDAVRVVRRFDDGWAYAENRNSGLRGLFPIDCLRDADQDLPEFLAAKHLDGYTGTLAPVNPPSRSLSRMSSVHSTHAL